jgi:NADH-quinone oxidoreductase subunit J
VAVLLGLAVLAWVVTESTLALAAPGEGRPRPFFVLFALVAIGSAVRLITHHRPVYAALYFVLVVLSSAGLFLLLEAEFMAFALVIVYAGAILITYLFVLMLAQQAQTPGDLGSQPEYDRVPREPAGAVVVGFVMLALLSELVFTGPAELPAPPTAQQVRARAWKQLNALPDRLVAAVRREVPDAGETVGELRLEGGNAFVQVRTAGASEPREIRLPDEAMPENIEQVGLALIAKFPVSLELAGVILLMAMFGAVILARRQIELSEEEKRAAAEAGGTARTGERGP